MSNWQFGGLAVLLVAIIGLQAVPRLIDNGPSYQYKIVDINDEELVPTLDKIGAGGWDLVFARRAMDNGKGAYEVILKRLVK
jgi:hypothetical protein